MKGEHDDQLQWPFKSKLVVELEGEKSGHVRLIHAGLSTRPAQCEGSGTESMYTH